MTRILPRLIVVELLLIALASVQAQEHEKPHSQAGTLIEGGDVFVVVPKSGKVIAAYSVPKAKWARLELEEPLQSDVSAGHTFAYYQTKTTLYAFSATTAHWSRLDVPENSTPQVSIHQNMIRVVCGDWLYIYGINSDAWSGINVETGEQFSPK